MLIPLIQTKKDPLGSMGDDTALACLSDQPRMLYDYFKQLFAQVTNPSIDSIREEVIMSLECYIGPEGNLLRFDRPALPSPRDSASDPHGRRTVRDQASQSPRLENPHDRCDLGQGRRNGRPFARNRTHLPRRPGRGDRCRATALIVLSDRSLTNADRARYPVSTLLAVRGRPSSSRPQRAADADRHCVGNRRGSGGPPPLSAGRLRSRRHQSLHRLRSSPPGSQPDGEVKGPNSPTRRSSPPIARGSLRGCSR